MNTRLLSASACLVLGALASFDANALPRRGLRYSDDLSFKRLEAECVGYARKLTVHYKMVGTIKYDELVGAKCGYVIDLDDQIPAVMCTAKVKDAGSDELRDVDHLLNLDCSKRLYKGPLPNS